MKIYLYRESDSLIHRLDPRSKMAILIFLFFLLLVRKDPFSVGVSVLMVLSYSYLASSLSIQKRFFPLLFLILLFSAFVWIVSGDRNTSYLTRFYNGLERGIIIDLMVMAGINFLSTTRNEEIIGGLQLLKVPYPLSFAFSFALRLVPTFVNTGFNVIEAQKSRGLKIDNRSIFYRLKTYIPLLGPILLIAIRNATQLSYALESKGFGYQKHRTSYLRIEYKIFDYVILTSLGLLSILIILLP